MKIEEKNSSNLNNYKIVVIGDSINHSGKSDSYIKILNVIRIFKPKLILHDKIDSNMKIDCLEAKIRLHNKDYRNRFNNDFNDALELILKTNSIGMGFDISDKHGDFIDTIKSESDIYIKELKLYTLIKENISKYNRILCVVDYNTHINRNKPLNLFEDLSSICVIK